MSFNYASAKSTAERLIAKFGGPMTLKRKVTLPSEAWAPQTSYTDVPIVGVQIEPDANAVKGGLVDADSRRVLTTLLTGAAPITEDDKIEISGEVFTIVAPRPLQPNPSSVIVLYDMHVVKP
jgi:hypothetical protein